MAIYAIGDTHLSFGTKKPMDIFSGWADYEQRIAEQWTEQVKETDTVVLVGDLSWAMTLDEAYADFLFLNRLPGTKIVIKGNHDYWWTTQRKLQQWKEQHAFSTIHFLNNNAFLAGETAIAGSRGWNFGQTASDLKIYQRELIRLRMSLEEAKKLESKECIVFLHHPPVAQHARQEEVLDLLHAFEITKCCYGHIHGENIRYAINHIVEGISFKLISSDALGFCPYLVAR